MQKLDKAGEGLAGTNIKDCVLKSLSLAKLYGILKLTFEGRLGVVFAKGRESSTLEKVGKEQPNRLVGWKLQCCSKNVINFLT